MQIYDKRLDEIKPYENNPRHNDNAVDAEKETKVNAHHIGQVANKKYGRKTAGGYHWEWA